jgi:hypothetical protein
VLPRSLPKLRTCFLRRKCSGEGVVGYGGMLVLGEVLSEDKAEVCHLIQVACAAIWSFRQTCGSLTVSSSITTSLFSEYFTMSFTHTFSCVRIFSCCDLILVLYVQCRRTSKVEHACSKGCFLIEVGCCCGGFTSLSKLASPAGACKLYMSFEMFTVVLGL